MFTYYVWQIGGLFYVRHIFTGGLSQPYTNPADAEAVRDWLQFGK